jgi:hypothetical protein
MRTCNGIEACEGAELVKANPGEVDGMFECPQCGQGYIDDKWVLYYMGGARDKPKTD